ncbi:UNVERIFIED_CONTAM: hypothetical protein Sradi_1778300 [Sesamum radiatum]|uniref:DUF4218 domain-containing protein n=1 Tax=Sesamum radiatum TaxID=300843 RepID=A0AAW2TVE8_SESRA
MSWHATHKTENGVMCHSFDVEAWKHFNETHPDFDLEPRNIRHGLCADGFAPHGQYEELYFCWPVIIRPYNIPPGMCMKSKYMFLSLIIPGPANPKRLIDVYLQPLIEELVQLWQVGAQTYDASRKEFFMMRAALMWTVNDFSAYGMLSSWSTAGIMGSQYVWIILGCVDLNELKLHGMKSHDCHVFMDWLIPIAFREMLPESVWNALIEKKVKNKAAVEASICEAYIVEEISTFTTHYFEPDVICKKRRPGRNDDDLNNENIEYMSIFNHPGRPHDELFILAQQAIQVYYTQYPSLRRDKVDWMAVCRTRARQTVESRWTDAAFQEDEVEFVPIVTTENEIQPLHDINGNANYQEFTANDIDEEKDSFEDYEMNDDDDDDY